MRLHNSLILSLLLAISLFTGLFSTYNYRRQKGILETEQRTLVQSCLARVRNTLELPVYNFDATQISTIAGAEMNDPRLLAIAVVDAKGKLLAGSSRDQGGKPSVISVKPSNSPTGTVELVHADGKGSEVTGGVSVFFDRTVFETACRDMLWMAVVQVLAMNLAFVVLVWALVRTIILKPLSDVSAQLIRFAAGDFSGKCG